MDIRQRLSMLGIVSGAAAWGALIIAAGIIVLPSALNAYPLDNRLATIGGCLFWGGPIVALVGLGVGIAGMVKCSPHRPSSIAGVVLPGSALVGAVLFFIVAAYAVLTLLSNQP